MTALPDVFLNASKKVEGDVNVVYVSDSIVYVITDNNKNNSSSNGLNLTKKLSDLIVVIDEDTSAAGLGIMYKFLYFYIIKMLIKLYLEIIYLILKIIFVINSHQSI